VALDCLALNHSFSARCKADGGAPYPTATEAFTAIWKSDDLSKGGCPALDPPSPPTSQKLQETVASSTNDGLLPPLPHLDDARFFLLPAP
jgi:hypothetical protein